MQFNPTKCTVLRMTSSRRKPRIFNYSLCGHILNSVDSNPYLGVEISRTLSWNLHIDNTVKKANSVMGLVRRNLYAAPKETKSLAYQSIVRPSLEYAASIWDPHTQKNIDKLEKVQRSAARFVCSDYRRTSSVTSMLSELKWPSLKSRRETARLTNFYKIKNGELHVTASKRLIPSRSTRLHQSRYKHLPAKSDIYKNSYFPQTIVNWNALPPAVVEAPTTQSFKERLKLHVSQQQHFI